MNKYLIIIIAIILCAAGLIGWYFYEASRWEIVQNNSHILKIKEDGIRLRVKIPDEKDLYELLDMSVFNEFETGYDFDEAVEAYGRPDNVSDSKGIAALEYWRENGRVQVVRQVSSNSTTWSLRAYPNGLDFKKLFKEDISTRINPKTEESIVVIYTGKGDLLMLIVINGYRVDYLSWLYLRFK
jgi:hypothetical protein